MSVEVETRDASSLTEAQLEDLAAMGGAFNLGQIMKAKEEWVLFTVALLEGKVHGFTFSTLERIGGTPCVLLGMLSVKRTSKRDAVLKGLMGEAYHRALMAFPDEDVVVGSRFSSVDGLEAFKSLTSVIPRPAPCCGRGARVGQAARAPLWRRCQLRRAVVRRQVKRSERVP